MPQSQVTAFYFRWADTGERRDEIIPADSVAVNATDEILWVSHIHQSDPSIASTTCFHPIATCFIDYNLLRTNYSCRYYLYMGGP